MSYYWGGSYSRKQRPFLTQEQDQLQLQAQAQLQDQDQDQNQKNVFKEIGNVHIDIDNTNIAVAVLAILGVFLGSLDSTGVQSLLDRYLPNGRA